MAVGVLSLLSRSSLMVLEGEVVEQHQCVADTMARELSRAVAGDMRLLAVAAGAADDALARARRSTRILRFGHIASAAFVVYARRASSTRVSPPRLRRASSPTRCGGWPSRRSARSGPW